MHPLMAWAVVEAGVWAFTLVVAAVLAYLGLKAGLFLATVSVLAVVTAFCGALGLAPDVAAYFSSLQWMPALVLPLAYFLILTVILLTVKAAVALCIREDDAWLSPRVDRLGGGLMGAFAGWLASGALLVGWSMIELPSGVRPPTPSLTHDAGSWMLKMFARLCESKPERRERLLYGDSVREQGEAGGNVLLATEPFDDVDLDGRRGEQEPFIDHDTDGTFTIRQPVAGDTNAKNDTRDVGLLDRYWLSAWRRMRVLHPPLISSVTLDVTSQVAEKGELVYPATVKDPDPGHESQLKYSLKAGKDDDSELLTIDMATGVVKFREDRGVDINPNLREVHFTLIVEDPSGLTDEKDLEVKLRPPQMQSQESGTQAQP